MTQPDKLTPDEAKRAIRLILDEGTIELSFHCRHESMPKRGITMPELLHALRTGEVVRAPEWDDEHQQWKYRVEGLDTEGDELTSVTLIFDAQLTLYIITVF